MRMDRPAQRTLLDLPVELLMLICSFVAPPTHPSYPHFPFLVRQFQHVVATLMRVHRSLFTMLLPALYKLPTFHTLRQIQLLFHTLSQKPSLLLLIQGFHLGHLNDACRTDPELRISIYNLLSLTQWQPNRVHELHLGFIKHFTSNLRLPTSLQHLYLQGTQLSSAVLFRLLDQVPHLHTLSLAWNRTVTDNVLKYLSQRHRSLVCLDLTFCQKITNVGLLALASGLPHLQRIGISFCPLLTMDGFMMLMAMCRALRVCHLVTPHHALILHHWQYLVHHDQRYFPRLPARSPTLILDASNAFGHPWLKK